MHLNSFVKSLPPELLPLLRLPTCFEAVVQESCSADESPTPIDLYRKTLLKEMHIHEACAHACRWVLHDSTNADILAVLSIIACVTRLSHRSEPREAIILRKLPMLTHPEVLDETMRALMCFLDTSSTKIEISKLLEEFCVALSFLIKVVLEQLPNAIFFLIRSFSQLLWKDIKCMRLAFSWQHDFKASAGTVCDLMKKASHAECPLFQSIFPSSNSIMELLQSDEELAFSALKAWLHHRPELSLLLRKLRLESAVDLLMYDSNAQTPDFNLTCSPGMFLDEFNETFRLDLTFTLLNKVLENWDLDCAHLIVSRLRNCETVTEDIVNNFGMFVLAIRHVNLEHFVALQTCLVKLLEMPLVLAVQASLLSVLRSNSLGVTDLSKMQKVLGKAYRSNDLDATFLTDFVAVLHSSNLDHRVLSGLNETISSLNSGILDELWDSGASRILFQVINELCLFTDLAGLRNAVGPLRLYVFSFYQRRHYLQVRPTFPNCWKAIS